ncbi:hypothetical protein ABH898_005512 [Paenibacillus sp. RC82]
MTESIGKKDRELEEHIPHDPPFTSGVYGGGIEHFK